MAGHDIIKSMIGANRLPEDSPDGQRLQELGWFVGTEMQVWAHSPKVDMNVSNWSTSKPIRLKYQRRIKEIE